MSLRDLQPGTRVRLVADDGLVIEGVVAENGPTHVYVDGEVRIRHDSDAGARLRVTQQAGGAS